MYLLYRQGFAVSKSIRAVLFVFRPGREADTATLNSCTGWVQHTGRFRETRAYTFSLTMQLSKGSAEVFLLDSAKQPLLKLDRESPSSKMELDKKSRYFLRWEFKSATGNCKLHW